MKKLAALIAVLFLLAGAGAGGWWVFRSEPPSQADGVADAPAFVTLPTLSVPVIRGDRVGRTFAFRITLELVSAEHQEQVKAALPRLIDAFLIELHGLLSLRLMEERGYDLALLVQRLKGVANHVLGPDRVRDILIRAVDQR